MRVFGPQTFSPRKLHQFDDLCWAVVGDIDGAILAVDGKLLMRLTFEEARLAADYASTNRFQHLAVDTVRQFRLRPRACPRAV